MPMRPPAPLALFLLGLLAACGPVPRPFESEVTPALLDNRWAMLPVTVQAEEPAPADETTAEDVTAASDGTASDRIVGGMIRALEKQDIAASPDAGPFAWRLLVGRDGAEIVWRLFSPDGALLDEQRQPLPPTPLDAPATDRLAGDLAPHLADRLRGADAGAGDQDARPRIALLPIQAPNGIDPHQLGLMMRLALTAHGIALTDDPADTDAQAALPPTATISGRLDLLRGAGRDTVLQVQWTVRDAQGQQLGTVGQGGPVDPALAQGDLGLLARDIATAGAPGIAHVLEKGLNRPHP